ncbi:hypothetical protein CLOM_g16069 [Closterium sp. NIES-68]|nr:hypothetical protein CLOM_g16069 [Closterium sp. NIES-68]GJP76640.1 hypothetical protein CLOP_g7055 [Closterium sp. NIES-67]
MARVALAVLFVSLCASVALAEVCPGFVCGPGNFKQGKFTDPTDPYKEPADPLHEAYFTPGQMYQYEKFNISDDLIATPQLDCYKVCEYYNMQLPSNDNSANKAKYWMFEETCLDATGGICTCYNKLQCKDDKSYSSKWMEPARGVGTEDYEVPANFTVGELCEGKDKGDPHFTGADGSHFDFSGKPNRNYALVSDPHFQMNGFFGGRYSRWNGDVKALTWIRSVGIMAGHHTVVLEARRGGDAEYGSGYLARVVADGAAVEVTVPGTTVQLWDGATLRWEAARSVSGTDLVDVYDVKIEGVATIRLTLRPEVKNLRTPTDAAVHFGLDVLSSSFSHAVHGVLGQTFRPDFQGRLAKQQLQWSDLLQVMVVPGDNAEGFIDGRMDDYEVADLLKADCKLCRFTRAQAVDEEMSIAMNMMGSAAGGGLPAAPRKYLAQSF